MTSDSQKQFPKHRILVSCAGLGMGNASRMLAVMESLAELERERKSRLSITVLSWGAGHQFLKKSQESSEFSYQLLKLRSYSSQHGKLKLLTSYFVNNLTLWRIIIKEKPDLLLLDSDYHFLSYLFFKKTKIYVGQAYDVLLRADLFHYQPDTILEKINFLIRERMDAFYQSFISTEVLVPTFSPTYKKKNFTSVPLIVRKEFMIEKSTEGANGILMLLSGSQIEKEQFLKVKSLHTPRVVSPSENNELEISSAAMLDSHRIIFTQGGLSSISEVIARNKALIVFPLNFHPEQILNAMTVEKFALGLMAQKEDLENLQELLTRANKILGNVRGDKIDCSGARKCAEIIFNYFPGSSQRK